MRRWAFYCWTLLDRRVQTADFSARIISLSRRLDIDEQSAHNWLVLIGGQWASCCWTLTFGWWKENRMKRPSTSSPGAIQPAERAHRNMAREMMMAGPARWKDKVVGLGRSSNEQQRTDGRTDEIEIRFCAACWMCMGEALTPRSAVDIQLC